VEPKFTTADGKLTIAREPNLAIAALSYAMAASTAVLKVPRCRVPRLGSLISEVHLPDLRCRTPRYLWWMFSGPPFPRGGAANGVWTPGLLAWSCFVLLVLHANKEMFTLNLDANGDKQGHTNIRNGNKQY
jgi:hypothetical protein